ncbi:uncharacterized protein LOC131220345 [Magnolia sinica]|uniref:uncharacterized protein LOC131220345 n=1 Tax=Magnolia sinica TaxID=86752 RepID=UPI00265902BA|nr:uncharacterized protein LOC131220345 [Magnolia sinica]
MHRPPTFAGTHRPEEAEYWLNQVTKLLRPLHCFEAKNVELVSYLFKKEADLRWESVIRSIPENHIWTWEAFEARFNKKYIPQSYQHERENEFLRLQQGGMSVAQYENRFTELSRYASEMIVNKAIKMRRFTAGLRSGFRSKMCCASIRTYAELVEMSIRAEQDEEWVARNRSQLGPRNRIKGPSSSFAGKRARPNSLPRLAATPAPSARLAQICTYCRRAGHSEPYCFTRMRDLGFTPLRCNIRPPQQALQIPPLRAMGRSQQSRRLPPQQHLGLRPSPFVGVKIIAAAGTFSEATKICHNCPIDLGCKVAHVDLIVTKIFYYDVILGMDWLTVMKAEIDCDTMIVKIHEDDGTSLTFSVQGGDELLKKMRERARNDEKSEWRIGTDGGLWCQGRLCVPNLHGLREEVLKAAHNSKLAMHPGSTKMYRDLKRTYWWDNMKKEIAEYVS